MAAYRYWRLVVKRWRNAGADGVTGPVRVGELQFVTPLEAVWPQAALTSANTPAPYVVTASGSQSTFLPYKAFDGIISDTNRWLSVDGISPAWLQVDMGQQIEFDRIRYAPDSAATLSGGYFSVDFAILASNSPDFEVASSALKLFSNVTSGWANNTLREFSLENMGVPSCRALPLFAIRSSNGAQGNQPGPPNARGLGLSVLRRNHWHGGNGRVRGTVAEKGTPNAPVHRKVRLFHESTGVLVAEVWSDAITGAYSFDNMDASPQKYTVISYDHTGAFRAVVANGQIPELMP